MAKKWEGPREERSKNKRSNSVLLVRILLLLVILMSTRVEKDSWALYCLCVFAIACAIKLMQNK